MPAFQLYRTSWFSQNLSRRALNVFMVVLQEESSSGTHEDKGEEAGPRTHGGVEQEMKEAHLTLPDAVLT